MVAVAVVERAPDGGVDRQDPGARVVESPGNRLVFEFPEDDNLYQNKVTDTQFLIG